ncbi:MAG: Asp23/Gls24 family envelope stress response protein [Lachnospiraceae bacterium]|nr:Asp23/Gls24 family envelope stress response protein [Lachnospiraceae bacterium]
MAQEKNTTEKYSDANIGTVQIADDVVALIAAFAAMEVEGVSGMAGGADMDAVSKGGMKRLGKTVKVEVSESGVKADLNIELVYGYSIPETCSKVQKRVKTSIENMTGLEVQDVNIRVAGIK